MQYLWDFKGFRLGTGGWRVGVRFTLGMLLATLILCRGRVNSWIMTKWRWLRFSLDGAVSHDPEGM